MRLFISWSGTKSRDVAVALRDWLPGVINSIEPFVSAKDIYAGARWQMEIATQLESTDFGIVCVTAENQHAPWLNFEAGALAKAVDSSRVVPLAIDLKPSDVQVPLGQFQAQPASESGLRDVLTSINAAAGSPLNDVRLERAIEKWWPDLESNLQRIEEEHSALASQSGTPARSDRELLEEVLDTVRSLARGTGEPVDRTRSVDWPRFALKPPKGEPTTLEMREAIANYLAAAQQRKSEEEAADED